MEQFDLFAPTEQREELYKVLSGGNEKEFVAAWLTFATTGQIAERIVFEGVNYSFKNAFKLAKENISLMYKFAQLKMDVNLTTDNRIAAYLGDSRMEVVMNEQEFTATLTQVVESITKPISEMNFVQKMAYYRIKHEIQLGLSKNDLDGNGTDFYFKNVHSIQWLAGQKADLENPEKIKATAKMLEKFVPEAPEEEHFVAEAVFHKYLRYDFKDFVAFPIDIGDKIKLPGYGMATIEKIEGRDVYLKGEKRYKTDRSHINEMELGGKLYKVPFGIEREELQKYGAKGSLENRRAEYYNQLSEYEIIQSAVVHLSKTKVKDGYKVFKQAVLEDQIAYAIQLLKAGKDISGSKETIFMERNEQGYAITCGEKTVELTFEKVIECFKEILCASKQDVLALSLAEVTLKYRELGYVFEYYPTARTFFVQHTLGGDAVTSHTHKRKFWNIEDIISKFNHKKIS